MIGDMDIDRNGTQILRLNGKVHREDGPAIVYRNGTKCWYFDGLRHRDDGPAIILVCEDNTIIEEWSLNNQLMTDQVEAWIERLGLKPWREWGDLEITLFKISF